MTHTPCLPRAHDRRISLDAQVANVMAATVNLCKGKSVPKDAVGRQRARAAAAAALDEPGAVMSDDLFPLFHLLYGHCITWYVCRWSERS